MGKLYDDVIAATKKFDNELKSYLDNQILKINEKIKEVALNGYTCFVIHLIKYSETPNLITDNTYIIYYDKMYHKYSGYIYNYYKNEGFKVIHTGKRTGIILNWPSDIYVEEEEKVNE